MRTPLLASLIAILAIPACTDGITGVGGDDQMQGGATCGNGVVETGEQCDDSNTAAGDGCSASCQTENLATPHAVLSVDKATVTTDLNVEEVVVVTATSAQGFAGDVTLTVSAADGATAITDWTTSLQSTTLTVPADGTATTMLTLKALGDTSALTGTVKVSAGAGAVDASVAVTFNPVLRVTFNDNGNGICSYPLGHTTPGNAWKLKVGRSIAVVNGAPTLGLTVHTDGTVTGFPHEQAKTAPGDAYTKTVTTAAETTQFYCHNVNDTTILAPGASANYQYLTTVP